MCLHAAAHQPETFKLFDLPEESFDPGALRQLGAAMFHATPRISMIPSGYVYLGQIISHDISRLPHPTSPASDPAGKAHTSLLDLDGIYGNGFSEPWVDHDTAMMLFRSDQAGKAIDLLRDSDGKALIGDDRNEENLAIAQLHLQFLRLHNFFATRLAVDANLKPAALFTAARDELMRHYQQVVLYDFLDTVLDPRVWEYVIGGNNSTLWKPRPGETARLPLEFAAAAFRFGHSMIRTSYQLNDNSSKASLEDLLQLTHAGLLNRRENDELRLLSEAHVIQWKHFFRGLDPSATDPGTMPLINLGFAIDVSVPVILPNSTARPAATRVVAHDDLLTVKNLLTGNRFKLPSGQAIVQHLWKEHRQLANELRIDPLTAEELNPTVARRTEKAGSVATPILDQFAATQAFKLRTPLWYYILAEAKARQNGQRLGPLGSLIVAESIRALALQSKPCILEENFASTHIVGTKDIHGRQYLTMSDLLKAVA